MPYPQTTFHHIKKIFSALLLLSMLVSLSSCAAFIAAGAGAGAYSYISGNLVKTYDTEYYRAVRAGSRVMKQLKFKVTGKTGDALKTVLKGKRADGTPVTIEFERVKSNLTKIGVRNGLIGISNLKASEQIHQRLGQQLPKQSVAKKQLKPSSKEKIKVSNTKVKTAEKGFQPEAGKNMPMPVAQAAVTGMTAPEAAAAAPSSLSQHTFYIYYNSKESNIPATAYKTLEKVADYLLHNPSKSIDIRGYTDSKGDPGSNLQLSQKWADDIRSYLQEKGVASNRVTANGYGATNFLESNRTENLRAMNRRVVLRIH